MTTTRWAWVAGGLLLGLAGALPSGAQTVQQGGAVREPRYACSITVPRDAKGDLAALAKVPLVRAVQAAQGAVPGTVLRSSLDDENGCLVYSVEIRAADGTVHDVKADAGTGAVVHQETGTRLGPEVEGPGEHEGRGED